MKMLPDGEWSRCYATDELLEREGLDPESVLVRKALALDAWDHTGTIYRLPDELFNTVMAAPPPAGPFLSQMFKWSDPAIYLETPAGVIAPSGRTTQGVLAFWTYTRNKQLALGIMLNHGSDTSVHMVPDLGPVKDCLDATCYYPSGTPIRSSTAEGLQKIISLLLFASTYRDTEEEQDWMSHHGRETVVPLGRRVLKGYVPMATGRWLRAKDRFVFMVDPPSNRSAFA